MLCKYNCCIQVNVRFIHKCKKNRMEYEDKLVKCLRSTGVELHCIFSYDLDIEVRDYQYVEGRKKEKKARALCEI